MQQWHKEKNPLLSPETVIAGSHFRVQWICPVCLHEWQCPISTKVRLNTGCPKCAQAHPGSSKDGIRQKQPTFASCDHPLLSQWDHELSAREGNYPDNTTLGSHKQIWWRYDRCPKGNKHSWSAICHNRTKAHVTGCPCCPVKQPCD